MLLGEFWGGREWSERAETTDARVHADPPCSLTARYYCVEGVNCFPPIQTSRGKRDEEMYQTQGDIREHGIFQPLQSTTPVPTCLKPRTRHPLGITGQKEKKKARKKRSQSTRPSSHCAARLTKHRRRVYHAIPCHAMQVLCKHRSANPQRNHTISYGRQAPTPSIPSRQSFFSPPPPHKPAKTDPPVRLTTVPHSPRCRQSFLPSFLVILWAGILYTSNSRPDTPTPLCHSHSSKSVNKPNPHKKYMASTGLVRRPLRQSRNRHVASPGPRARSRSCALASRVR